MRITSETLEKIRNSPKCQAAIAEACEVRMSTIENWLRNNSENLTLAASVEAIKETLGLGYDQILEKTKA